MAIPILVISARDKDLEMGHEIAKANRLPFQSAVTPEQVRNILTDYPQAIIFWDADHPKAKTEDHPQSIKTINQVLLDETTPNKVFVVTDGPLNQNLELSNLSSFGHHVFRRYEPPAYEILSRLLAAALVSYPFGIERYMPEGAKSNKITLRDFKHKAAAVQAVQNLLDKNGTPERLAAQVAQSADELLINAIFNAPVYADGKKMRIKGDIASLRAFKPKEEIELSMSVCDTYTAICIADQYGSLKKEVTLSFIRQNFKEEDAPVSPNKGIGLNGIIQSGLSLLFICKPEVRTEVIMFFPKVENYKDFRTGFRFLSLLSD